MTDLNGHLELLILSVLQVRPMHGYGLIEELYRWSARVFELKEGTVYPLLHSLERRGLISSERTVIDSRPRRTYSLTAAGKDALEVLRMEWRRYSQAVENVTSRKTQG